MTAFGVISTTGHNNVLQSSDFAGNDYSETDSSSFRTKAVLLHRLAPYFMRTPLTN